MVFFRININKKAPSQVKEPWVSSLNVRLNKSRARDVFQKSNQVRRKNLHKAAETINNYYKT